MTADVLVVMAAKNASATIDEAILSILSQSYTDFRLTVVDDASDDDTGDRVESNFEKDGRVRLIRNSQSLGRAASRNIAILASSEPFIAIADSDDRSRPLRIERQLRELQADSDLSIVGAQVADFGSWGGPIQTVAYPISNREIKARFRRGHNGVPHQASMFRRVDLGRCGLYEPSLLRCQDLELFLRLAEVGSITNLAEVLVEYRTQGPTPSLEYFRENAKFRKSAQLLAKQKTLATPNFRWRMKVAGAVEILRWVKSRSQRSIGVQHLR